jgi:heptosyltransferase-2
LARQSEPQTSAPPARILLLQTAFVGDVVFASPLVHAIKQRYPQARLALMVRPATREVARCIPGVDEVLTFDKRGQEAGLLGLARAVRRIRRGKFDLLISPHRSARSSLLALLSGVPRRVGYRRGLGRVSFHLSVDPEKDQPCLLAQDLRLLERAGIAPVGMRLRLKSPAEQAGYLEAFRREHPALQDGKWAALCIGSMWPTKRWPPIYFASLAGSLKARGYVPILFGSAAERPVAEEVERNLKAPVVGALGNTLAETAALLERCAAAIGGDSGLTHMARALGVPTLLIYGPTDEAMHAFGEGVRVLSARVKCRPCSRHGQARCPLVHHDCMRLVSPEQVLAALRGLISLQTPVPAAGQTSEAKAATPAQPVVS